MFNSFPSVPTGVVALQAVVVMYFRGGVSLVILGNLSKTTTATATSPNKGLMSKAIAVHARYKCLYISLPFSATKTTTCGMTKFCVFWRTWAMTANILDFLMEFIAGIGIFSLSRFLDRFAFRTGLVTYKIRE